MHLEDIEKLMIDDRTKGVPGAVVPFALKDIGQKGWNVLREDMPLPLAVIKQEELDHNRRWMAQFLAAADAKIAPHGKTTMCPQLFQKQLEDGAWGITAASVEQIQVYRHYGVPRILMANQLVGKQNICYILNEIVHDEHFDFFCLVDSKANLETLTAAVKRAGLKRPLQVLLEIGLPGGRTGVRSHDQAMVLAEAINDAAPHIAFKGIETFEGAFLSRELDKTVGKVDVLLNRVIDITKECAGKGLFASGKVILSAGGSAFFDMVTDYFSAIDIDCELEIIIRSGCYLTHDSLFYNMAAEQMRKRSKLVGSLNGTLTAALEVWAYVQSIPEEGLAIATLGKRDISADMDLPKPLQAFRPEFDEKPYDLSEGHSVASLNDQHCYITLPSDSKLQVGDMISFGVCHPCTTFDKWQLIPIVDNDYSVIDAVKSFF